MSKKIAVFFDCENISAIYVKSVMEELSKLGDINIAQAYMDWSSTHSKRWCNETERFGIKQIHVQKLSAKNCSDIQIVIDVMETIYTLDINTIVLVSSDSDFRNLVFKIKAKGYSVFGYGEQKTSNALRNVYTEFIELPIKKSMKPSVSIEEKKLEPLKSSIKILAKNDKYVEVSKLGNYLTGKLSLSASEYGSEKWGEVLKKYPQNFELKHLDKKKSKLGVKLLGWSG